MEISPLKENGSWWQCRTRLERRLSLCATVAVLVACGIAIVMATVIYQGSYSQKVSDMASTAAALTETNNCELHDSICNTPGCVIAAADLLNNMDKKVDPCEDFYSFACGGFEAKTVVPENEKGVDVKTLIREQVDHQVRFLMEKPIKEDEAEPFKQVKKLYQSCVNPRVEELEMEPLKETLQQLGGWPVVEGEKWNETNFVWYEIFYKLRQIGYYSSHLIELTHKTDKKNFNTGILVLDQGLVRYPEEDLLTGLENKDVKARLEYEIGLAKLLGADEESARLQQTQALEFGILFTNITLPYREHQKAKELDNRMTIKELSAKIPGIPWVEYINTMLAPYNVITEDQLVNVVVPDYFSKLVDLLAKTPKRTLANYFMSKVSFELARYLNKAAARKLRLKYLADVYGTNENKPRWKECMDVVKLNLDLAKNAMYVREFFDEDTRQSVKEMFRDIQNVFIEMFDEADWIDNKTREHLKKKATFMTAVIAYPDELLREEKLLEDYENLTLGSNDFHKNFLNLRKSLVNKYFKNFMVNKEDVPKRYTSPNPFDVAVYNFISENSVQIHAAILQGAFFRKDRPNYLNYAAIGQLLGYTITLSFQEKGQKYDHEGNVGDWWEASTKEIYQERTKCIIDQYGNYTIPELGLNLDGASTKGTNIGDNEGIKSAYRSYIKWASRKKNNLENWDQVEQRLPGLSEYNVRQLFWLQAARSLCEKMTPDELKSKMSGSVFSPSRFRVQGAFANMPQFASDFNCPVGSVMNPVKKCTIW